MCIDRFPSPSSFDCVKSSKRRRVMIIRIVAIARIIEWKQWIIHVETRIRIMRSRSKKKTIKFNMTESDRIGIIYCDGFRHRIIQRSNLFNRNVRFIPFGCKYLLIHFVIIAFNRLISIAYIITHSNKIYMFRIPNKLFSYYSYRL